MISGLRGWVDYDRPQLAGLNPQERITYLEWRVRRTVIRPLRRILKTEIMPPNEESSALLIFGVSLCCAIEASGKFLTGDLKSPNKARFDAFLRDYMAAEYCAHWLGRDSYGTILRKHFRNGLAHGFTVCHGGFEGNPGEPYLRVKTIHGHQCLEINPTAFLDDYANGFDRYLADLRAAVPGGTLYLNFDRVYEAVYVRGE